MIRDGIARSVVVLLTICILLTTVLLPPTFETAQAAPTALATESTAAPAPQGENGVRGPFQATDVEKGARNQHTARSSAVKSVYAETDPDSTEPAIYIVQLVDAPTATYRGELAGLAATSPAATGARRLDLHSAASRSYRAQLADARAEFRRRAEATVGRTIRVLYEYDTVFNGIAMQLTPQEAVKLLALDNVASIQRDQWRFPTTGDSPAFLGVPGIWDGTNTGDLPGTKGEGVIVGVIDSGIWPEHPSFADDGTFPVPPTRWQGGCDEPSDDSLPYTCNNKLIGVKHFIDGYAASTPGGYDGLFYSGRDDNGHGTHTASTAAGNENVPVAIYGINRGLVSGMAPRAHVAAYKGLGPSGGVTSDLTAAIETAVEDGVDVINYSVGSDFASNPWGDVDALAYLAAREAGVFVATSAGNDGPGVGTVGSPANAPWLMAVGASYFNRLYLSDITITGPGSPPSGLYGATSTGGVSNFRLVDAAGIPDVTGVTEGTCNAPFAPGTFQATDAVLCRRGDIATWAKGNFVNNGGAGAVVLYNQEVKDYDFNSYLHPIPALVILHETGITLKDYLAANPGADVRISFTQGEKVFAPDSRIPIDTVVGFSSRGPALNESTNEVINVLKPDVTAPGIHILAGASPQYVDEVNGAVAPYGAQGQLFQLIQGTSMSSPHVAGLGALMKALYPDWSPSEIQSALMMTANSNHRMRTPAGDVPADPFAMGAGRVDMTVAAKAGFVLHETAAAYTAADPARGGNPSTLNIPSLNDGYCVGSCTWQRTLSSTVDDPVEWTVSLSVPPTLTLTVSPTVFTLGAGGVQALSFVADVTDMPLNGWAFGEVIFTPNMVDAAPAHFPVAVRSSPGRLPAELNIETRRNVGQYTIENLSTVAVTDLAVNVFAAEPETRTATVAPDPTNSDPYDLAAGGIYSTMVVVPDTTKRFVVETFDSTAPDLDLYVGLDTNGNGLPDADEELCSSTSAAADEICDFPQPGSELESGTYWILVQNWAGSGAPVDTFTLSTAVIDADDVGQITGSGPASVSLDTPFALQINWDIANFQPGDSKFGVLELRDDATNIDLGSASLTLTRLADDVSKRAAAATEPVQPGTMISYTIDVMVEPTVQADTVRYLLTDTLPAGVTYVPNSASVPPTSINGNQLLWDLELDTAPQYKMSTSADDPLCDTGFGGYVNLADFGIFARPSIAGDGVSYRFDDLFGGADPVSFFGIEYLDGLYFTDDGFGYFDTELGPNPGMNTDLPNPALPNNLLAAFWRDLEIVYDEAANRGVSAAGAGSVMVVEYDAVEPAPAGSTSARYTFEIVMDRFVNDAPGFYEIVFAYDNMGGPLSPATIGLENADGTKAVKYAYNDATLTDGLMICFDWARPGVQIDYQVMVDGELSVPDTLTNMVTHDIDAPGYAPAVATVETDVPNVILDIGMTGPTTVLADSPITYTVAVTNSGLATAPAVVAEIPLPAATELVSGGTVDDGIVTIEMGDLPGGSSQTAQMIVMPLGPEASDSVSAAQVTTPASPDIVGGGEAEPGAWPWQVALMFSNIADGFRAQFCGGTLIAPNWVLTAGHCVTAIDGGVISPPVLDVAVGRHTLSSNEGARIAVSQIVRHPDYTEGDFDDADGDVALLRLAEAASLSATVDTIQPLSPGQAELAAPYTAGVVIGWGARTDPTDGSNPNYADALYQTTVPIVPNDVCGASYDALYETEGVITDSMLCAGFAEGGKDACFGDSGGPLMVSDGAGGWLQAGIVSWGEGCAQPGYYGVYARASAFYRWIMNEGRNTYTTDGRYSAKDAAGHSASGFNQITTVVVSSAFGIAEPDVPHVVVRPDSDAMFSHTMSGIDVSLSITTGTVNQIVSVGLEDVSAPTPPVGFSVIGTAFSVQVFDENAEPIPGFVFKKPVSMQINYAAALGSQGTPGNVTLQYYDRTRETWQIIPAAVSNQSRSLTASITESGTYAVLAEGSSSDHPLYLPLISDDASAPR